MDCTLCRKSSIVCTHVVCIYIYIPIYIHVHVHVTSMLVVADSTAFIKRGS